MSDSEIPQTINLASICEGACFQSKEKLQEALDDFAIEQNFEFKVKKSDKKRLTIFCRAEGCPWTLHASKSKNSNGQYT
jgi:hypothetical protein